MINEVDMRELVVLDGGGVLLHGTYHKPADQSDNASGAGARSVGVMFMNALSSPRSLVGDSGAYWASSFAASGYPSFRFDLPGLGDTYGEIPNDLLRFTSEGGYAAVASSKTKELVHSRGLSGVVLFGHCAGASTAIYAAARCKECKGLILMDPFFNLQNALTSTMRPELVLWARRSRIGALLRAASNRLREGLGALRKGSLPANANFTLITRLKQVASTGIPILILRAHQAPVTTGTALKVGTFDYLSHVLSFAVRKDQFSIQTIESTDHSFSNRAGRSAVLQHAEAWLSEHFHQTATTIPLSRSEPSQIFERPSFNLGSRGPIQAAPGD